MRSFKMFALFGGLWRWTQQFAFLLFLSAGEALAAGRQSC